MKSRIIFILITTILFSCSENKYERLFELSKKNDFVELTKLLNNNKLILDTIDNFGFSPLGYAVKNQNIEMINLLLKNGANVNFYKTLYSSPFYLALESSRTYSSIDSEEYHLTNDEIFNEIFANSKIIGIKNEIIKIIASNELVVDKNNDDGKFVVELMREIDDYDLRKLTFTTVIEDTIEIKKRQLNIIKYEKEREEREIKYKKERQIRLVSNPNIRRNNNAITFNVANVELAKNNLQEKSYMWAIQSRPIKRIEYCNKENYTLVPTYSHPFVNAVEYAYADHRPLILSPDIVWLLICQGFSKHIEVNNAKFRDRIVDFQGKKRIDVVRNDFIRGQTDSLWQEIIIEFTEKTMQNVVDTSLYNTIVHSFSTTTNKELIAFDITFLEINRHYFDYTFWACGIPEITLEGTTEDWIWIRQNIETLKDYELDWWVDKLIPIIDEFVNASNGNIDLKFWSEIYRKDQFCNHEITGWFTKFFPYIRKGNKLLKNPLLLKEPVFNEEMMFFEGAIENENFPSGLSIADFRFIDRDSSITNLSFVAGFVGIKQDKKTKALKPEINWLITD